MERRVIEIDQESCEGCGRCVDACTEDAIGMINGKARLVRDDFCDGLGNCIPVCPRRAIHFIIREAAPFDEAAVKLRMLERSGRPGPGPRPAPKEKTGEPGDKAGKAPSSAPPGPANWPANWPVKIALASPGDAAFDGADVLVAADCAAYACPGFQETYANGRVRLIGCPRLEDADYERKLEDIFRDHDVKSILVVRMDLPCCEPLGTAARKAAEGAGKEIPAREVAIGTDGKVRD